MKRYNYIRRLVDKLTSIESNNVELTFYNHLVESLVALTASSQSPYTQVQTDIQAKSPTSVMTIGRTAFISRVLRTERLPMP